MNVDELNSTLSRKAIPKSAPKWAKKNALATVSTVVTTLAAAVAIFAWLGLKPAIPLGWDEAYVTHEQFNLLLVSIVKSVEKIETELGSLKEDIKEAKGLAAMLEEMEAAVVEEPRTELPENEPIPITPNANIRPSSPANPLKDSYDRIQGLQREQRTLRR